LRKNLNAAPLLQSVSGLLPPQDKLIALFVSTGRFKDHRGGNPKLLDLDAPLAAVFVRMFKLEELSAVRDVVLIAVGECHHVEIFAPGVLQFLAQSLVQSDDGVVGVLAPRLVPKVE